MKQLTINMKEQLTDDTATRTCDLWVFATRKPTVNGQVSMVKCPSTRGFTIVETLVAIAILLIAVVGPISLIGDALQKLYYARDEMVAINLAQEGIEVVRYVRDSNMLATQPWTTGFHESSGKKDYVVDIALISSGTVGQYLKKCTSDTNKCLEVQAVVMDNNTGFYRQNYSIGPGVISTPFKRFITTDDVSGNVNELKVTSTVEWMTGGQAGSISVTENLFKLK